MSFNVLLVSPPIFDFYSTYSRSEPIGLYYLKESVKDLEWVNVEVYDAIRSRKKKQMQLPLQFDYLKEFYHEDISYFSLLSKYSRFGDSFGKIITKIKNGNYSLVGISAMFSGYFPDIERLIKEIKLSSDVPIVIGGWAVWAEQKKIKESGIADYYITENELSAFRDLVIQLSVKNNPIAKKDNKSSKGDLLDIYPSQRGAPYLHKGKKIAKVLTSKGCPYGCTFCSVSLKNQFTERSFESIEAELEHLYDEGYEIINFEDDNLFHCAEETKRLLEIIKKYHYRGMSFAAMNGINASNILPFVDDAIDSGFIEFNFSLAVKSKEALKKSNRPFDMDVVDKVLEKINGRVDTVVFVIAGLPDTSPEDCLESILFLSSKKTKVGFSPLYLLPGVKMFTDMGLPEDRMHMRGSALYKFPEGFTREDVASLWKLSRMINKIKSFDLDNLTGQDLENIMYFRKSIEKKQWYKKNYDGTWTETFKFNINIPDDFEIITENGDVLRICDF